MSLLGNTGLYEEDTLSLLTIEEYEALHSELKKKYTRDDVLERLMEMSNDSFELEDKKK